MGCENLGSLVHDPTGKWVVSSNPCFESDPHQEVEDRVSRQ